MVFFRQWLRCSAAGLAILSALGAGSREANAGGPYGYAYLKDLRASQALPKLPDYTLDQQKLVLSQARLMLLDLYAHLELKQQAFAVNPKPALDELQKLLDSRTGQAPLDQADFHGRLIKIFDGERDLHTIYFLPKPYACYGTALAFSLNPVRELPSGKSLGLGPRRVAISKIAVTAGMLAHAPNIQQLSIGDIVTLYDGEDPVKKLDAIDPDPGFSETELGGGANKSALSRRAVEQLTYHSNGLEFFPVADDVKLHIRKLNGKEFDITFPWISIVDQGCLNPPANAPSGAATGSRSSDSVEEYERRFEELFHPVHADTEAVVLPRSDLPAPDALLDLSSPMVTKDSIVKYKVLTRRDAGQADRKFGYLRLDSFVPSIALAQSLDLIKGLLSQELANTEGLIIDVRNNGGGAISYGEQLVQFFSRIAVEPLQFRLRATEANRDFLASSTDAFPPFLSLLQDALASPGTVYTATAPVTPVNMANGDGQFYFKPVAVLTNSSCYSTCDMFTAGVQDNGAGEIWSEDKNTGGGGANNMHYTDFAADLKPDGSLKLPALPAGQDIGIAWRQAVRAGKHDGEIPPNLLEDKGVHADHDIPSSPEDLALNNLLTVRTITDHLIAKAKKTKGSAYFSETDYLNIQARQARQAGQAGTPLTVHAQLTGTTGVTFLSQGQVLGHQKVGSRGPLPKAVSLTVPLPSEPTGRMAFQGYLGRKPSWRKSLLFRYVPAPVTAPISINLDDPKPAGIGLYTPDDDAVLGWTAKDGHLQIGAGPLYTNNLFTDASLFVALPQGLPSMLAYTAKIDTEADCDFFTVSVLANGQEKVLGSYSGKPTQTDFAFDLAPYAGQTVEIRFRFMSDPGVVFSGVFLSNLSVM